MSPAGTIIVDTPNTYLYLVLGDGKALRYGVGVGRQGFTWSGAQRVTATYVLSICVTRRMRRGAGVSPTVLYSYLSSSRDGQNKFCV